MISVEGDILRYYIDEMIGDKGAFGAVYECHSELEDKYAIKILKTDDVNAISRFQKEVRLTSRLNHPNIIKIVAQDTTGDRKYYIMPRYNCSLFKMIPELYNDYDRQYKVISEILNGMVYLHEQGVLHRDLKPQNILYNTDTDIAINDLGLSRQVDSSSVRLTQIGDVFGTQRYISPEQAQNSESVDERTDIYAFGKILEDIVTNLLKYPIPNEELEYIIEKCTNAHQNRRFTSILEVKSIVDSVYRKMLKITSDEEIDSDISLLEMGLLDNYDITELAIKLISCTDEEKIEKYFFSFSESEYKNFEKGQLELAQKLIYRLKDYYTSQSWGFDYTDTIGSKCRDIYDWSNDNLIKALLLYTILEVGIYHNRFYVIGIGEFLIKGLKHNLAEAMELKILLEQHSLNLSRLDIAYNDLPDIIQKYV